MSRKLGIVTECVCDLPEEILKEYDIPMIYFEIQTDHGNFYDTVEISVRNVFEYILEQGHVPISKAPDPSEYIQIYEKMLKQYDAVLHITISGKVSESYAKAKQAVLHMGESADRVYVFDSGHLSTGQGHLIIMAAEMAKQGIPVDEIITKLERAKRKISTSFIVENVDFLYYNGRLPEKVKKICDRFKLHPVLAMKNGELALDTILLGSYDFVSKKYIKRQMKNSGNIEMNRIFLTHAGCSTKILNGIKKEIKKYCVPEKLIVTEASATVSSNCGPNAFGILFCKK